MNIAQLEKLKALIASSPILNVTERAEWLALLELMNDKQLGELEKILLEYQPASEAINKPVSSKSVTGAQILPKKAEPSQQVNGLVNSLSGKSIGDLAGDLALHKEPIAKLAQTQSASKSAPVMQLPHLSHIMNLPNHWDEKKSQTPLVAKEKIDKTVKGIGNKQSFASKLKSIFLEKELTTSKPEYPLELADRMELEAQPVAVEISQIETQNKPTVHLPEVEVKTKTEPIAVAVPKPKVPLPKISLKPQIIPEKPVWKPIKKPDFSQGKFIPGVEFKEDSIASRNDTLANVKKHLEEKEDLHESLRPLNTNVNLNGLADLKNLTIDTVDSSDLSSMVNKIRQMISKYGFFEVIFNLEDSWVYKSYLATGVKLMSENTQGDDNSLEKVMNKSQFEKFADLLSKIQSA